MTVVPSDPESTAETSLPEGPEISTQELFGIFTSDPFSFLKNCMDKYGDMFTLPLGDFGVSEFNASGKWVFLTAAEDLKTLYKAKSTNYLAGKANYIQFARLLPIRGSVMLDGTEHIERRKVLSKLIQGEKNIRKFANDIIDVTRKEIANFPKAGEFELAASFQRMTSEIMRHMNFGAEDNPKALEISTKLSHFGEVGLSMEAKNQIVAECDHIVADIISEYKQCPHAMEKECDSMLSTLVSAQKTEGGLSDIDLQAELVVLLVAGTDTTATALTWTMAQLFANPMAHNRVVEELTQKFAGKSALEADDFDDLPYLEAVILEVCRIIPQLFTTSVRLLTEPLQIGNHLLPAGTIVANTPYLVHTRSDHYDNPDDFIPERFIGINPDPYKHVFFGGGTRRCIGMAFALYEMKVIIALLLLNTKFKPVAPSIEPELQGAFFGPKGGVMVELVQ